MNIGDRLREERERLGLNQTVLGAVGGVRKQAQLKYEAGDSFPNAQYLSEVAKIGVDILYVVTGKKSEVPVNDDEKLLLGAYRNASSQVKAFMLQGVVAETSHVLIKGNVNQSVNIEGDVTDVIYSKKEKLGK